MPEEPVTKSHEDYTVGWICALSAELAASQAVLDIIHKPLSQNANDTNSYTLGEIGGHNIAMACLPMGQYGTNNAATVATNMLRTFTSIRVGLLVGIGGGVPIDVDIRLGDIVVGDKVIQHDLGKVTAINGFCGTGAPKTPPLRLLNAVSKLRAVHEREPSRVPSFLHEMREVSPEMERYACPPDCEDLLFHATYDHGLLDDCGHCNLAELKVRAPRSNTQPKIHYGGIASGNQVIKSGRIRDGLARELGVLCFEMEAAGLTDNFPCIVIRGICDYADSHKNKMWQPYAAATAAAYAKELLTTIPLVKPVKGSLFHEFSSEAAAQREVRIEEEEKSKERFRLESRRILLLQSLTFERINSRRVAIDTSHANTCEWLLQSPTYTEWRGHPGASQRQRFLWISGKPGVGKSTIMKFALNSEKSASQADENAAVIAFFFNARGDTLEKSTFGLYRSLLFQLLKRFPDLQSVLNNENLISRDEIGCPTVNVIKDLFRDAIIALGSRNLTCFIDALDECDEAEIRKMVVYFEDIGDKAELNSVQLKICFSSRHYPHIDIRHGLKMTLETQDGHEADLLQYIKSHLRAGEGPYVENLHLQILFKASGVFMWAILVVEILNKEFVRGRRFRVEQRLHEMPIELGELFKNMIRRDNENMEDLSLCIQWILFAKRPLSRREFYFAMLSGMPDFDSILRAYDPISETDQVIDLFITSASKGLAEVTEPEPESVQFIHESVRDFFIKGNGIQELWPDLQDDFETLSHETLKKCCISSVRLCILLHSSCESHRVFEDAQTACSHLAAELPFVEYATRNVLHHANMVGKNIPQDDFMGQFPFRGWVLLNNIVENNRPDRQYTSEVSLVYVLAERNFVHLLQRHVSQYSGRYPEGEFYGHPFFAALVNGYPDAAKALLGQKAEGLRSEELLPSTILPSFGRECSPFQWAIQSQRVSLARHMLYSGHFGCLTPDAYGFFPIHRASMIGDESALVPVLESASLSDEGGSRATSVSSSVAVPLFHTISNDTLVGSESYLNSKDPYGRTALDIAAEYGHEAVARRLLNHGASSNVSITCREETITSLIVLACESGHLNKDLIRDLHRNGLVSKQKLLHHAATYGFQNVVQVVVKDQAHIDKPDSHGRTPLEVALGQGNLTTAQILVEKGASFGNMSKEGVTAAFQHDEVAEYLVENYLIKGDTALNMRNRNGQTPLYLAVINGRERLAEILVASGADVDVQDSFGQTPLHQAVVRSQQGLVGLFLDHGASIDAQDQFGQTPLHKAALGANIQLAEFLIRKAARTDLEDTFGWTPLQLATDLNHPEAIINALTISDGGQHQSQGAEPDPRSAPPDAEAVALDIDTVQNNSSEWTDSDWTDFEEAESEGAEPEGAESEGAESEGADSEWTDTD